MLLRPLHYPNQKRIGYVEEVKKGGQELSGVIAYPNYLNSAPATVRSRTSPCSAPAWQLSMVNGS